MIIGKDKTFQTNNQFQKSNQSNEIPGMNPMIEATRAMQHTDVTSKTEMNDKAFAMLQERLNNGLISMKEFNKMCRQLGKSNDK